MRLGLDQDRRRDSRSRWHEYLQRRHDRLRGELRVDGTSTGSAITLASGATLSGTGSVGAVTSTGGTIAPGDGAGAVGTLTVAGLTLDSTTHVNIDVVSATSYDQIASSGAITLGNAILTPTFGGTTASTDRLEIIKNSSGIAISGVLNQLTTPLPENALVTDGRSHNYNISYGYNDGSTPNNVVLKGLTATTTTFTAAPTSPVTYGDTLTYTVHVSAGAGTPAAGAAIQLLAAPRQQSSPSSRHRQSTPLATRLSLTPASPLALIRHREVPW